MSFDPSSYWRKKTISKGIAAPAENITAESVRLALDFRNPKLIARVGA
jgi:hypothetical protein